MRFARSDSSGNPVDPVVTVVPPPPPPAPPPTATTDQQLLLLQPVVRQSNRRRYTPRSLWPCAKTKTSRHAKTSAKFTNNGQQYKYILRNSLHNKSNRIIVLLTIKRSFFPFRFVSAVVQLVQVCTVIIIHYCSFFCLPTVRRPSSRPPARPPARRVGTP